MFVIKKKEKKRTFETVHLDFWSQTFGCYRLNLLFLSPLSLSGAGSGPLGSVPAPDQHGADLPAAAAGDGHAEAAGRLRAAGGAAVQMRGRAEKGQVTGQRPGGLHR